MRRWINPLWVDSGHGFGEKHFVGEARLFEVGGERLRRGGQSSREHQGNRKEKITRDDAAHYLVGILFKNSRWQHLAESCLGALTKHRLQLSASGRMLQGGGL